MENQLSVGTDTLFESLWSYHSEHEEGKEDLLQGKFQSEIQLLDENCFQSYDLGQWLSKLMEAWPP